MIWLVAASRCANQETAGSSPARVTLGPIVYWLGLGPFKAAKTGRNRLGLPRGFESGLRYQSRVA